MSQTCTICSSEKSKYIDCQYCQFSACDSCWKQYFNTLATPPKCMGCKAEWQHEYLITLFPKKFMNELSKKEAERLWSHQWQLMPQTQQEMENQLRQEQSLRALVFLDQVDTYLVKSALPKETVINIKSLIDKELREFIVVENDTAKTETEKEVKFIKHCPKENCNGFLSTGYKCGLCQVKVCSKCLEMKEDDHECTEDNLKSAEMIKKDSKNCPKCGVGIYKISGCNDMWCVHCNTRFCWRTLKVMDSSKGVHNPHYFEYIERLRGNNRVNNGCRRQQDIIASISNQPIMLKAYRFVLHQHDYYAFSQETYDRHFNQSMLTYRRQYLSGHLTKEQFIRRAFLLLNLLKKKKCIGELENMLYISVSSIVESVNISTSKKECGKLNAQLDEVRIYYNNELESVRGRLKSTDCFFIPIPIWQ